jgi:hypothetical protein
METLTLPVSIGEAIDKLTILDIKLDFIKDERRKFVETEYNLLFSKLEHYVNNHHELYKMLKYINTIIWHEMDLLRDANLSDTEYLTLCRKTILDNDIRFRIKNKINNASRSSLKEQKGYHKTGIFLSCQEYNNIDDLYLLIQYFSVRYDETIVDTKFTSIENKFGYDHTIEFSNECQNYKKIIISNKTLNELCKELNIDKKDLQFN